MGVCVQSPPQDRHFRRDWWQWEHAVMNLGPYATYMRPYHLLLFLHRGCPRRLFRSAFPRIATICTRSNPQLYNSNKCHQSRWITHYQLINLLLSCNSSLQSTYCPYMKIYNSCTLTISTIFQSWYRIYNPFSLPFQYVHKFYTLNLIHFKIRFALCILQQ